MKIVTLNVWGGVQAEILFDWIKKMGETADVFCFQEIFDCINAPAVFGKKGEYYNLKNKLKEILPDFVCFYREHSYNVDQSGPADFFISFGLATFVKKTITNYIVDEGDILVYGAKTKGVDFYKEVHGTSRNLQYIRFFKDGNYLNIINFHGTWIKNSNKVDHDSRYEQSSNIVKFLKSIQGEVFLTGDFNLLPNTNSLLMVEEFGLTNLIKTYEIASTRSILYDKPIRFADYSLVSSGVKVKNFFVENVNVSDHLPLIAEIVF